MSLFREFGRLLGKPSALWSMFTFVLILLATGLAFLTKHAFSLSQQQQLNELQKDTEQSIRVALWRLDSRLAPFIATLHDPVIHGNFERDKPDDFIVQRFTISQDIASKARDYVYMPAFGGDMEAWNRLQETIPVDSVVAAVDELIAQIPVAPDQALLSNYAQKGSLNSLPQQVVAQKQRRLQNRQRVVEDQVDFNSIKSMYFEKEKPQSSTGMEVPVEVDRSKLASVWIKDELLIMRKSQINASQLEGAWLDWRKLRESLRSDIEDILPLATLHPIRLADKIDTDRALAALPVMIAPGPNHATPKPWTSTHTAFAMAWMGLLVASLIAALALGRLISLSERRASFVSAVTHELRTPLTTFRLYSDLLARDMVSDPSDRKEYLETLRREADRLTHLVDNVLRYSKLQRTSKLASLESIVVSGWLDRIRPRLESRLAAANMTLEVAQNGDGPWSTDPPAMEQVLFNLIDNAAKYAVDATDRRVHLEIDVDVNQVMFRVTDHGPGVPESLRGTIFKPFAKSAERAAETAAGVGLGLALVKQTATALGGTINYEAGAEEGACFRIRLPRKP